MLKQNLGAQPRRGFTLLELVVVLAIFSVLLALAMPTYRAWMARTKIRVAAESMMSGLVYARNQALQRNAQVQFSMTDTLANGCALTNSGSSWVVSMGTPTGQCAATPSETVDPRIMQKRSGGEGGTNSVTISALNSSSASASRLIFNGLGRALVTNSSGTPLNPISRIDFSYPALGSCMKDSGPVRCLRIVVTPAGEARICDPSITATNDPRYC